MTTWAVTVGDGEPVHVPARAQSTALRLGYYRATGRAANAWRRAGELRFYVDGRTVYVRQVTP